MKLSGAEFTLYEEDETIFEDRQPVMSDNEEGLFSGIVEIILLKKQNSEVHSIGRRLGVAL